MGSSAHAPPPSPTSILPKSVPTPPTPTSHPHPHQSLLQHGGAVGAGGHGPLLAGSHSYDLLAGGGSFGRGGSAASVPSHAYGHGAGTLPFPPPSLPLVLCILRQVRQPDRGCPRAGRGGTCHLWQLAWPFACGRM